jgi:hypothetical protein
VGTRKEEAEKPRKKGRSPMKRMNQSAWSLLVIIALVLIFIHNALKLEFWVSKIVPMLVCILILILSLIAIFKEIFHKQTSSEEINMKGKTEDEIEIRKSPLPVTIWILGYFAGIYFIGFLIATPLFVGGYMKQNGSKWSQTLVTTVIFSTLFIILFNYVLKADLYHGVLISALSG